MEPRRAGARPLRRRCDRPLQAPLRLDARTRARADGDPPPLHEPVLGPARGRMGEPANVVVALGLRRVCGTTARRACEALVDDQRANDCADARVPLWDSPALRE